MSGAFSHLVAIPVIQIRFCRVFSFGQKDGGVVVSAVFIVFVFLIAASEQKRQGDEACQKAYEGAIEMFSHMANVLSFITLLLYHFLENLSIPFLRLSPMLRMRFCAATLP